jgi:hypothetical protein
MNMDVVQITTGAAFLAINLTMMCLIFPFRRSLKFTVSMLILYAAAFYAGLYLAFGTVVPNDGGLPALTALPVMILIFKGKPIQIVFAYFMQFFLTSFQVILSITVSSYFVRYGGSAPFIAFTVTLVCLMTVYAVCTFAFARRLFARLFAYGRPVEWRLYSLGAIFSFAVITTKQIAPGSIWNDLFLLLFILSGFTALCLVIINAHEKARHKYNAEFAQGVISSGSSHYQKMNELYDMLGILRHDYKYHMKAIGDFVDSDDMDGIRKYLSEIQAQIPEDKLRQYCANPVLNSLLGSYAERCEKLNIKFTVSLTMPDTISVPNYEFCIIFGNLLENAVEACAKLKGGGKIELVARTQEDSLFTVMVKNRYNGELSVTEGTPVSTKKDGGFGLRSVRAVSDRYEGHMLTEWDRDMFSVYVMLNV